METQENQNRPSFFQSNTAKMALIALLTLILLIPLEFVKSLIEERALRQSEVISEINEKWGQNIYFYGPILKIPYTNYEETISTNQKTKEVVKQKTAYTNYAYFFSRRIKYKIKRNYQIVE
jgi:inner membrane protein